MSVITTSVSGLSSILKSPGIRRRNVEQRVHFRLPESLKTVLLDFINRRNIKAYEELIYTIRDGDIQVSTCMCICNFAWPHVNLEWRADSQLLLLLSNSVEYLSTFTGQSSARLCHCSKGWIVTWTYRTKLFYNLRLG
jgi:hypothetical protein